MILLLLNIVISFGIELSNQPMIPEGDSYVLYSKDDVNYVLTKDTIFSITLDGKGWNKRKHYFNLNSYDLVPLIDESKTYLLSRGHGKVYLVEHDTVKRIDNSYDWRSRYFSSSFLRNEIVHTYGGYGLFSVKSNIVYLDSLTKEWNVIYTKNQNSHNYINSLVQYDQIRDEMFFGFGKKPFYDIDKRSVNKLNTKIVKYNFKERKWLKLGELNKEITSILNNFDKKIQLKVFGYLKPSLLTNEAFYEFDFAKNTVNKTLIHSNSFIDAAKKIIYNHHTKTFLISHESSKSNSILISQIEKKDLLNVVFEKWEIYTTKKTYSVFITVFVISILILYFLLKKYSKNYYEKVQKSRSKINSILSMDEKILLDNLMEKHPKSISYPEIISLLNYNLSYESNIKKTQKILVSLNDKIQKKLATKDLILYTKRSDIDKRIKVVGFNK